MPVLQGYIHPSQNSSPCWNVSISNALTILEKNSSSSVSTTRQTQGSMPFPPALSQQRTPTLSQRGSQTNRSAWQGLSDSAWQPFPPAVLAPSPGQGAQACQSLKRTLLRLLISMDSESHWKEFFQNLLALDSRLWDAGFICFRFPAEGWARWADRRHRWTKGIWGTQGRTGWAEGILKWREADAGWAGDTGDGKMQWADFSSAAGPFH